MLNEGDDTGRNAEDMQVQIFKPQYQDSVEVDTKDEIDMHCDDIFGR